MDISTHSHWARDWRCKDEPEARTPALQDLTIQQRIWTYKQGTAGSNVRGKSTGADSFIVLAFQSRVSDTECGFLLSMKIAWRDCVTCGVGGVSPAAMSGNAITLSFSTHLDIVLFQHGFLFTVNGKTWIYYIGLFYVTDWHFRAFLLEGQECFASNAGYRTQRKRLFFFGKW